ncbi:hypothetical protein E2C01_003600 [Portunus trituberculatus]|uniref:Uncharacterized protein n=1 Tax=Portunus trituberculatus TaxID=210409 RepID=A0A5B7CP39_PORTR|nr:hypothetical protein [Portunus trituberculatus]
MAVCLLLSQFWADLDYVAEGFRPTTPQVLQGPQSGVYHPEVGLDSIDVVGASHEDGSIIHPLMS